MFFFTWQDVPQARAACATVQPAVATAATAAPAAAAVALSAPPTAGLAAKPACIAAQSLSKPAKHVRTRSALAAKCARDVTARSAAVQERSDGGSV